MSVRAELRFFPVADVRPASEPLDELPYIEGVHRSIGNADLVVEREAVVAALGRTRGQLAQHDSPSLRANLDYLERRLAELRPLRPLEGCSRYRGTLVRHAPQHPLIATLECAFRDHRPVVLSPDIVWLTIGQGLACHIRKHADELRGRFVTHAEKVTLKVRHDGLIPGSPEDPWDEAVAALSEQVRTHLGESHGLFVADFSTTGAPERVASEIVLLDAMQGYFEYEVGTEICGIPAIALDGAPEDWERIEERVDAFGRLDLGLDWWLAPLRTVLRRFTVASRGQVDTRFWQSIFRIHDPGKMCYPHSIFGWVAILFPYVSDHRGHTSDRNPWLTDASDLERMLDAGRTKVRRASVRFPWDTGEDGLFPSQLPAGVSSVPFRWNLIDPAGDEVMTRSMELLGGFFGVAQDRTTLALRPEIGWAVREQAAG